MGALVAEPNLSDIALPSPVTDHAGQQIPGRWTLFLTFCKEDPLFFKKICYSLSAVAFILIATIVMIRQLVLGPKFSWNHVLNLAVFGVMSLLPFIQYGWRKFAVCKQGLEEFVNTGVSRTSYDMTYLSIDVALRPPVESQDVLEATTPAQRSDPALHDHISNAVTARGQMQMPTASLAARRQPIHHRLNSFTPAMLPVMIAEDDDDDDDADKDP
jgi:hypothetical protein